MLCPLRRKPATSLLGAREASWMSVGWRTRRSKKTVIEKTPSRFVFRSKMFLKKMLFRKFQKKYYFSKFWFFDFSKFRFFDFSKFRILRFLKISKFFEIFENFENFWDFRNFENFELFFLHDEKIFFIPIFFNDLDYVSRVPENYLEHSMTSSEEDIDRVWGAFSWFSWFS